jgi:hypothetical protein
MDVEFRLLLCFRKRELRIRSKLAPCPADTLMLTSVSLTDRMLRHSLGNRVSGRVSSRRVLCESQIEEMQEAFLVSFVVRRCANSKSDAPRPRSGISVSTSKSLIGRRSAEIP